MEKTIQNEKAIAVISSKAAEVISFKDKESMIERVWCRNPEHWLNCNPILFPYTGPLPDGKYSFEGKDYSLGSHGLARYAEFVFEEVKEDEATLSLSYDEDLLKVYPFRFKLTVTYKLDGSRLCLSYRIDNLDEKELPFKIGFHPAFNCPMTEDSVFDDYYLEFAHEEDLHNPEFPELDQGRKILLKDVLYDHQLFYRNGQIASPYVDLTDGLHAIRVGIEGYDTLGFWRKKNDTPFVCIEPWYPRNELRKAPFFKGEELYDMLPTGESFRCSYYWEIIH